MKKSRESDVLNQTELEVLKQVAESSCSISELGKRLVKSHNTISETVDKLQEKGLVTTKRKGMSKWVEFDNTKHAILVRNLINQFPHIPWKSLLAFSSFTILENISHNFSEEELKRVGSNTTFWRHLRNLTAHGVVTLEDKKYKINPRFDTLTDFFNEYDAYMMQRIVQEASGKASIIWKNFFEFLIRVPYQEKITKPLFHLTAISAFAKYGIDIISDFDYYFYTRKKERLSKEDYVLHTLLIDKGSVVYVTYALLFMAKFRQELRRHFLLEEAQRFGLEKQVNAMFLFLERKKQPVDVVLPSWAEFKQKAEQYGVM